MSKEVFGGWIEVKNQDDKIEKRRVFKAGKRTKIEDDFIPKGETLRSYINNYCGEEFIRFISPLSIEYQREQKEK